MKRFAIALALLSTQALAYGDYDTAYDAQSGNHYTIQRDQHETNVNGYNYNNGTNWQQTQRRDGSYSGRDAQGNYYQGNNNSGYYMNSNGTWCYGTGALRTCSR